MALRINTNIAAMNAHKNMIKNDNGLSASLEKLSSGLRINKAADDASGMAIADSLRSQGLSLGQAIKNANDGISMVQTADGALEESINIVNTIKTKAVQAAQDGQTTDSRLVIQADINKLTEELDIIARTTSFNNQKLLSGNFTNKKFQIGAYSGETVNISIGTGESTKIGHITTSDLTVADVGAAALAVYSNVQNQTYDLNSVDIQYDNTRENSMGALADAINKLSDVLGITANATVTTTTDFAVNAGTTDSTFEINGVHIGALAVQENDADGALVASINFKTDQHGVFASVDEQGKLTLTSLDDRAIEVTQDTDTTAVLGNTADLSTLGKIALTQDGTAEIVVLDRSGGQAVALADGLLQTTGVINTTAESILASGSSILAGSTIGAGSILATGTALEAILGTVYTTGSSIIGSGSTLLQGTIINSGSTLTGTVTTSGVTAGTGTLGSGSTLALLSTIGAGTTIHTTANVTVNATTAATVGTSTLNQLSIIDETGSSLAVGSTFLSADLTSGALATGEGTTSGLYFRITTAATVTAATTLTNGGATLTAGSNLGATSTLATGSSVGANVVSTNAVITNADMTLTTGSSFITASQLAAGTNLIGDTIDVGATYTLADDMTLTAGSTIITASSLATGSSLSNAWYNNSDIAVTGGSMTLGVGSSLATGAVFADGSSLGGTVTTLNAEVVDSAIDMLVEAGSTLATGTSIAAGTMLTNDVVANDGITYTAGTLLVSAITTSGVTTLTNAMSLNGGSILAAGSTLAANSASADASAVSSTSEGVSYRLSDVDVTTQENAQIAIAVSSAALKSLDKVRADLGSVQNQLTSTIANITVTRVNIFAAESAIRDVDFAEEASNFTKMQILAQAGSFAMAQANASSQTVLSLLQ
ncbi:MAG: flagellin [Desulfobacula sp.]|jgi:flagellin|nr:flagellin [Desulfobacula sp.]